MIVSRGPRQSYPLSDGAQLRRNVVAVHERALVAEHVNTGGSQPDERLQHEVIVAAVAVDVAREEERRSGADHIGRAPVVGKRSLGGANGF